MSPVLKKPHLIFETSLGDFEQYGVLKFLLTVLGMLDLGKVCRQQQQKGSTKPESKSFGQLSQAWNLNCFLFGPLFARCVCISGLGRYLCDFLPLACLESWGQRFCAVFPARQMPVLEQLQLCNCYSRNEASCKIKALHRIRAVLLEKPLGFCCRKKHICFFFFFREWKISVCEHLVNRKLRFTLDVLIWVDVSSQF